MTIETQQVRIIYTGDGTSTQFAVPFPYPDAESVQVYAGTGVLGSTDVLLALGRDYQLTGTGVEGGTVVLTTAPASGVKIAILRVVPYTQLTDYPEGGDFPAAAHEAALDKLTMEVQQLQDVFTRTPFGPPTSGASGQVIMQNMVQWYEETQVNAANASTDAGRAEAAAAVAETSALGARADADRAAALVDPVALASSVFNVRKVWLAEANVPAGGAITLPGYYFPTRDVLHLSYEGVICTPRKPGVEVSGQYQYEEVGTDPNVTSNQIVVHFAVTAGSVLDMWVVASAAGQNVHELEILVAQAQACATSAGTACVRAETAARNLPDVTTAQDGQVFVARNVGGHMQAGYENPPSTSVARLHAVLAAPLTAGVLHTVPSYIVGSNKLQVFMDGVRCEPGLVYQEKGVSGTASVTIAFTETLPAGTHITAVAAA